MRHWNLVSPPDLKPYFLVHDDLPGPFQWEEFFRNDHPVEIEIGTGRGLFLLNESQARPDTNFLGMELDYTEGRYAATRMKKRAFPNVRILGGDAKVAFEKFVPDGSVAGIHVYFPDPWWKRRHHGRRLMEADFVSRISQALKPGGNLHFWTDVLKYFELTVDLLEANGSFERLPDPVERPPQHDLDYLTNFERKKRQAGLPIYRSLWRKR